MTGCLPPRIGINHVLFPADPEGLNPREYTLPALFRDAGYRTMIVGKWHCGDQADFLPCRYGFDRYYGLPYSNDMGRQAGGPSYPPLPLMESDAVLEEQPDQRALTERHAEQCVRFIRESVAGGQRFFLYFGQMHVHLPLYAAERFTKESENGDFGACMAEADWACAVIAAELDRLGIREDTLFLFTSENGSRGDHGASNAPLRGGKFTTWEGGMRVPLLACWPGHIPAGSIQHTIFSHIDFLPTFARMLGRALPQTPIDGIDQWQTFFDTGSRPRREMAYFGPNRRGTDERYGNFNAYRLDDWKIHFRIDGEPDCRLYNLHDDIGEQHDLAAQYPGIAERLRAHAAPLLAALGDQGAGIPGAACRPAGFCAHQVPLTVYRENHPYTVALYDKDDHG